MASVTTFSRDRTASSTPRLSAAHAQDASFYSPDGDHFRTRLTHTLRLMQISRTLPARSASTKTSRAISLGHDLGHTPSHTGEEALSNASPTTDAPSATMNTPCASSTTSRREGTD